MEKPVSKQYVAIDLGLRYLPMTLSRFPGTNGLNMLYTESNGHNRLYILKMKYTFFQTAID